nr:g1/s-specific cyclin ccn1 [Quercus suber]
MPDIQSIEIQTEIQWYMRPYLLDFLLEAHHAFQLLPETLHLAVNLLDRYCSRRVVYKRHYQLVGCASLLIAAKYGDRKERVPTIRELKSMCCSLYDEDMFTQMEWHVLATLNWVIGHPTVTGFLQLALTEVGYDPELEHMSWYINELGLYHKEFIPVRPSIMARSALALARCILGRVQPPYQDWSAQYDPQVVLNLSNYLNVPSQALLRKYASPHLSSVSNIIDAFLKHQSALARRSIQVQTSVESMQTDDYLTPQTPQKVGHHTMAVGILTPPITPDKDGMNITHGGDYQQNVMMTDGLTPPSSANEQQKHYAVAASRFIQQPQFVQ